MPHALRNVHDSSGRNSHLAVAERRDAAARPNEDDLVLTLMEMHPDRRTRRQILGDHRHPDTRHQLRIDLDGHLASVWRWRNHLSLQRVNDRAGSDWSLRCGLCGRIDCSRTAHGGQRDAANESAPISD